MSVFDDPVLRPRATTAAAPRCGMCELAAKKMNYKGWDGVAGTSGGALGFRRVDGKITPVCRMHGGMSPEISLADGMPEWLMQDTLES